jgi:hypothetical protein
MREVVAATLVFLAGAWCQSLSTSGTNIAPQSQMVAPKVDKQTHTTTQTSVEVTRSCPAGYEGHFVDTRTGFGWEYWNGGTGFGYFIGEYGEPGYTICFSKEFMDGVRKNPDLLTNRPMPPRPV